VYELRLKLSSQESESKLAIANVESKLAKSKAQQEDLHNEFQMITQQVAEIIQEKEEKVDQLEKQIMSMSRNLEHIHEANKQISDEKVKIRDRIGDTTISPIGSPFPLCCIFHNLRNCRDYSLYSSSGCGRYSTMEREIVLESLYSNYN
jgi:hypothetical protein